MPLQPNHLNASQCAAPQECATVARPCTTLEDFFRAQDSQISFSVTHGWSAFGGADHGWQDVGLEGGSWTLSQPVFGPVRSHRANSTTRARWLNNIPSVRVTRPLARQSAIAAKAPGRSLGPLTSNACTSRPSTVATRSV